ncbi:hypothetical protein LPJ61_002548, partial [Coemansia biformis]
MGPSRTLTLRQFKMLPHQYHSDMLSRSRAWAKQGMASHTEKETEPEPEECTICLEEYRTDQIITRLPCFHSFHQGCIKKWLTERWGECPVCKCPVT